MGDKNDRLPGGDAAQLLLQPGHILRCPMAVPHFHQGPLVQPEEADSALFEHETIRAEDLWKVGPARL